MTVVAGDRIRVKTQGLGWHTGRVTLVLPQPEWCPHPEHATVFYENSKRETRIAFAMDVELIERHAEATKWSKENEVSGWDQK